MVIFVAVTVIGVSALIFIGYLFTIIDLPPAITNTAMAVICVVMTVYSIYVVRKPDCYDPICVDTKIINKK